MSKLLSVEEQENSLPILCFVGDLTAASEIFLKENIGKFRTIFVSSKKSEILTRQSSTYFVPYEETEVLPKLQEKIDYAVIFLNNQKIKTSLFPIIQKLKEDNTQTLFIIPSLTFNNYFDVIMENKNDLNFRFAILGELLTRKKLEDEGQLGQIIENAFTKKEIRLTGNDLETIYPVTIPDAMHGIYRLLFGRYKNDTVYYLFYRHPETVLSAAHILGRIDAELKITFSESSSPTPSTITRNEISDVVKNNLQMDEKYFETFEEGFEKGAERIFSADEKELIHETHTVRDSKNPSHKRRKFRHPISVLKVIVLGLLLFIILNFAALSLGVYFLKSSVDDIKNGRFVNVTVKAENSMALFSLTKPTVFAFEESVAKIDKNKKIRDTFLLLEHAASLSKIAGITFPKVVSTTPQLSNQIFPSLLSSLTYLYQEGQLLILQNNNQTVSELIKPEYSKLLNIAQIIPEVLAFDNEKDYLLLFQNNDELRPNGGFIGSVGELSIKNARINTFNIKDVYDLDGQLKNHIEPPFIVRRYLQPHLYLRDSNFSLDFQETASKAALLYYLESGKKPNGIIAVNLTVLKKILNITGPISLPEYNTTVDDKNVSSFIESTVQKNNFPGSSQKKDILDKVFNQLLVKMTTKSTYSLKLLQLIPQLLEEKNIMFAFQNSSVQQLFNANLYAGSLTDLRETKPKTAYDFLYINEANIGVNKVNANIQRSIQYSATISQNGIDSVAALTLTNNSKTDGYKSYLQIAVPKGSHLKSINIDNKQQKTTPAITDPKSYEAKNFKPPAALEVEEYEKGNNTIFAFQTTIGVGEEHSVTVNYSNGAAVPLSTITNYSLLYVKQPGTDPYELSTTIYYPDNYIPVNTSAQSYGKNFLSYDETISKDKIYEGSLKSKSTEK